ncbi:Pre-mRNA-splicing helicase BRR2 [Marasmius tenuissimus]|uniref:Pre-mRNA-splicing helicase BRR2 n=1 Tax=Marasmius tenuissimus TaxID=585030 RepID=A0ABR2ZV21_9AGAR
MSGGQRQDLSQYNYGAISSLVLTADRSALPRRDKEPDGAPTSLAGRIDPKEMGSRVQRQAPKDMDKKKKKAADRQDPSEKQAKRKAEASNAFGYADILESTNDVEGLTYRPRTAETRDVYQHILSSVHTALGDQAQDIVRSAADTVLETLKNEGLKDFDKKKEIEEIIGPIPSETFSQLVNLSKKITDYGAEDEEMADPDVERKEAEIDDEVGVAVVFDEEEDEEEDEEGYEVKEDSDEDEEEAAADEEVPDGGDVGEEELVIGGEASKDKKAKSDKNIVSPHSIDAFWVQRQVSEIYPDPVTAADKAASVLSILGSESGLRDCENQLMELFDYQSFHITTKFLKNRDVIVWCTKLMRSDADERVNVEVAMREKGVGWILRELAGDRQAKARAPDAMDVDEKPAVQVSKKANLAPGFTVQPKKTVDLDSMAFSQGGHLMSNKKCKLPEGSFKRAKKGYEEIHVPAPKSKPTAAGENVPISDMPAWAREAFTVKSLNRVQSKLYPIAFGTDEPILLCAPTGAGKTNVAMLTVLNELGKYRDEATGTFDLDAFKIVYVAPMKALVQEMVGNFTARLKVFGIKVGELTGDSQMTKQQIAETQIIVTTPEKWDVITRKSTDTSYTNLVRLIIIDEIHLLHDERGPVLESIIARTIRRMEQTGEYVRLVGLSATLPNYQDVATFLRVDEKKGLFYFDASYRPCGLQQQFIGITEKKAIKRYQIMNEVCYEKVLDQAGKNQSLVFVHSRKETAKTAKFLRDMAMEKETITQFVRPDGATREILQEESANVKDPNLKDLLPFGFAIHHAGMSREDRGLVEELFADGSVQVLVCTATLAWGVNLPAHSVIIKGTQIYNPEKGRWTELSSQDVLQMLGRAGRPQYDTFGEGIIITNHSELQYYLSLLNQQLPIESQFVSKLADNLNAEIVLGTIKNRDEAVQWLGYTYLYVRMLRSPGLYSVGVDYQEDDDGLVQKRADIVHSAAVLLEKCQLLKYERASGRFQSTELGRIASHYYVTHKSMMVYNQHLRPTMSMLELFRVFALSNEFKLIPVRQEEKIELARLLERVPIPVKESVEEPAAKINVLLQAYISQLKLDGFVLLADMVFVQQSAGRIIRAMFEICLKRGWAVPAKAALDLCKMVEKRMWGSMTPLRQFKGVPTDVVRKAEGKQFPWYRYFDLTPPEIGELIGIPNAGRLVHRLVHSFPKLQLQAQVQPITRSLLRIELTIVPDFRWDEKIHGGAETFWILVEDVDGEVILFHDSFVLLQRYAEDEHNVTFTVPMFEPVPPNYYISVISDRWLHAETRLPISFKHLILPEKFPPPTPLLDLQSLPTSALHNKHFEKIYSSSITNFNKIQTQNVFIGAPTGSGKTICAEFALLRLWSKPQAARASGKPKFADLDKEFVALTGETSADLRLLEKGDVIILDVISRRWRQRKNVQNLALPIADEVHLVGGDVGPTYEVIISRTRYVSAQTEIKTRIVACGVSLSNARDLGEWMGAPSHAIFNFSPSARPLDLDIHLQSFTIPHFPSLMIAMSKPAYLAICEYSPTKPAIIFVPSRKQCRMTVDDLLVHCAADENPDRFLNIELSDLEVHLNHLRDEGLKETLKHGIGYYHEALDAQDKRIVQRLFESGAVQVLVASKDTAWTLPVASYMVILMGTQYYEGKEHRYIDYSILDVLQMMGRACRPREDERSRCILMCQQTKKDFYKKFLAEGLPIESHLPTHMLHDYFLAEIAVKTIENKQDAMDILTWTYFYRRITQNPNYYNLHNVSHQHLSDHLSELVENTLQDLVNSRCIAIEDEMDITPLNLGMIAAYYNISYVTVEVFTLSLKERTKLKGLLEARRLIRPIRNYSHPPPRGRYTQTAVRSCSCQARLQQRQFRSPALQDLPSAASTFQSNPSFQQFGRGSEVDSGEGSYIVVCLCGCHVFKCLVERTRSDGSCSDVRSGSVDRDSALKQIPISKQRHDVAAFVNSYPTLEVNHQLVKETDTAGAPIVLQVALSRDADDEDEEPSESDQAVVAPSTTLGEDSDSDEDDSDDAMEE